MRRVFLLSSATIFLDEVVYIALFPLLPEYAGKFDLSKTEVGLLLAAYPLLMLTSSLPAGLAVDRFGGRRLLAVGCALLILASLGFGFAANEWQLWAARALQGLASGLTSVAGMAVIAGGAVTGRRATLIGLAASVQGLSAFAGPALGGFLAPALGVETAFLLPAAFGALVLAAILYPGWPEEAAAASASLRSALVRPLRSPAARGGAACVLACGLAGSATQTLAPLRLGEDGFTASDLGAVFLVGAVLAVVGTPLAGRLADRRGVGRVSTLWALLPPLLLLAPALSETHWVVIVLLVALVPLNRVGGTLGYALGAEHAPLGAGLAAGYGLALSAWSLGAALGPIAAGTIADAAGDGTAFAATAALVATLVFPIARARPARALEECAVA